MIYHITPVENLAAILTGGIIPQIGPRSTELGETVSRSYYMPSLAHVEDALGNWLGDELEDYGTLVILTVDPAGLALTSECGFELTCEKIVSPARIVRVLDEELNPLPMDIPGRGPVTGPRMPSPF